MKSFRELREEAVRGDAYWIDRAVLSFLSQITEQMQEKSLTKADLAKKMGSSKAYLSKVFSGSPNFTVATMVRLARAVHASVEIHVTPGREEVQAHGGTVLAVTRAQSRQASSTATDSRGPLTFHPEQAESSTATDAVEYALGA